MFVALHLHNLDAPRVCCAVACLSVCGGHYDHDSDLTRLTGTCVLAKSHVGATGAILADHNTQVLPRLAPAVAAVTGAPGLHRWHAPAHSTGFPSVGPLPLPPPPPRSSLSAGKKAEAQEARHADPLLVHIRQKVGDAAGHSRDEVALLRILCM
ncbi:hypothetical protein E2C01_011841 [Portunus trituberculatus]|uniref:Uncharacterized protein n=1 Tax=Portunus trituberculatus TaxID=210409 RepID=A0A5B7DC17_PORTR|nr:hypothetical protein [Portunus trituberculatus]